MPASAVVITATVGKQTLRRTVESVLSQSFQNVTSVVVVDGPDYVAASRENLGSLVDDRRVQVLPLPQNTGSRGYVCHRIYGAVPLLVNQDYVFYLDDDNWYEQCHVADHVSMCEQHNLQWSYGLRKIIMEDGTLLCNDDCESLGHWPVWFNQSVHHVDTNCYCLKRETAIAMASRWHKSRIVDGAIQPSADTEVCGHLLHEYPRYGIVRKYSVNYSLGSWGLSPPKEFFLRGNEVMRQRYGESMPWSMVMNPASNDRAAGSEGFGNASVE